MKKITAFAISIIISSSLFANNFSFGVEGGAGINTAAVELSNGTKSDLDFIPTFRFGGGVEYSFSEVTCLQLKTFFHHGNGFSFTDLNGKTKVLKRVVSTEIIKK